MNTDYERTGMYSQRAPGPTFSFSDPLVTNPFSGKKWG